MTAVPERLEVLALPSSREVAEGDDLAGLLLEAVAAAGTTLVDGDVVLVTSKVVSKAEGRVRPAPPSPGGGDGPGTDDPRRRAVDDEAVTEVATRGSTRIVRTRHGLVLAAAGVDASNTPAGTLVLLPLDPDASARALRAGLQGRTGLRLGVVLTDTAGRAWRHGQTDLAVGAAGVLVSDPHAGRADAHGNQLAVTEPALADELAAAADLVCGKATGRPFALVRGAGPLVLAAGDDGAGAASLPRPAAADMFGLGTREAALVAVGARAAGDDAFGAPSELAEVLERLVAVALLDGVTVRGTAPDLDLLPPAAATAAQAARALGRAEVRVAAVARAHGWWADPVGRADPADAVVSLRLRSGSSGP